jgi:glycosyltransferase involved in cell wall biosynthesis
MIKYPKVHLEFMGGIEIHQVKELFKDFDDKLFERVEIKGGTLGWEGYPKLLSQQRWDIGICPLIDDEFNRNKSHIKWMEYATYKIPSVASKTYPYFADIQDLKTIQHGKTGFLAKDTKEWVKYLSVLIENEELREEIGINAYEYIKDNWQYKDNIYKYKQVIDKLLKQYAV